MRKVATPEASSLLSATGSDEVTCDPSIPLASLRCMYRDMRRIRLLDARMTALQRQGRVGFYGASTGQEAPPIATAYAVRPEDWVFPALREGAIMLARGFPLTRYVAQVFGNALDGAKGRQMPSHMSSRAVNQVSWSSCIGTQLPHAVGAAWAAKLRRDETVCVAFCGDGATSQPDFHSAMNFATVFSVPCVIVCQNNHWAISVPSSRQTASATFAVKARAYAMPSARVDGNDVIATYGALREAIERARRREGPTFVECVTYRVDAHSSSDDPSKYRSEEEVRLWQKKDPIVRLARTLSRRGLLDSQSDQALTAELEAEIDMAITHAENIGNPARETLFEDVYAELPWHLKEQRELCLGLRHPSEPAGCN